MKDNEVQIKIKQVRTGGPVIPIPGSPFSPASPGTPGTPRSPWQREPPEKVHTAKLNQLGLSESKIQYSCQNSVKKFMQ